MSKYIKDRECCNCGKIESVRKDNSSLMCVSCSSSIKAKKAGRIKHLESLTKKCTECGIMYGGSNKKFCSRECRNKNEMLLSENRKCKCCDADFKVLTSSLKTNASGNFCSRNCYNSFMCDTERTSGRGSQWRKTRNEVIKKIPFCVMCGTRKNLQVHHIIPFRLTYDNNKNNLIPLCTKHHKKIEYITLDVLKETNNHETTRIILRSIFIEYALATASKLKEIAHA